jgi:trimeric autotransporter adhesin
MATRTISATGGNFNATGAWVEGVVPTAADDCVCLAAGASGQLTVNVNSSCRSFDFTNYTNTLTINAAIDLSIGDGTAGAGNVALKLVSGMTLTLGDSATSRFKFVSTSATQQTIATGGKVLGNLLFNTAGSWILSDNLTATNGTFNLTAGTVNTNGKTISCLKFSSSGSTTRTLTLGASSFTVTGTSTAWDCTTSTNMTVNANTSTITLSGTSPTMQTGGLTWNNISFTGSGASTANMRGAVICNNFTWVAGSGSTNVLTSDSNWTVSGTLTLTGQNAGSNRILFNSTVTGSPITVTCTLAPALTNCDFTDITAAGAGGTWSGTSLGDALGNSNITFTTPVTRYCVANSGWGSTASWASSSGGTPGASIPICHDTAILDGSSTSIQTNGRRLCKDLTCVTGYTGTLSHSSTSNTIYGSLTFVAGMTYTKHTSTITFAGRSTHTITTAGKDFFDLTFNGFGGTYTLQDALSMTTGALIQNSGTLNTNGFNVTAVSGTINSNSTTLTLGASTLTFTGTSGTPWTFTSGATLNANTSNIILNGGTASTKTFAGGSAIYFQVTFSGSGTGAFITTGSWTTNVLAADTPPHTIQVTNGTTITTNVWSIRGVSGSIFTLQSTTGGSAWNLTKTGGKISTDWISLQDSQAAGGAVFYAGRNSTNVSGNTGWLFKAAKDTEFMTMPY